MLEKWKNENIEFVKKWEIDREKGFKLYILKNTISTGIMMIFIFLIDVFINGVNNYLITAIVYILVTLIVPVLSWRINEKRYKKYKKLLS